MDLKTSMLIRLTKRSHCVLKGQLEESLPLYITKVFANGIFFLRIYDHLIGVEQCIPSQNTMWNILTFKTCDPLTNARYNFAISLDGDSYLKHINIMLC